MIIWLLIPNQSQFVRSETTALTVVDVFKIKESKSDDKIV